MVETYTLDEFCTGAWSDRPEYASNSISFDHIRTLHDGDEFGKCGETDVWYFLRMKTEVSFEFHLYMAHAWASMIDASPSEGEPLLWVYGTVFDGVREISGGQSFSINLPEFAAALVWLHEECCRRWPRFAEWYQPPKS